MESTPTRPGGKFFDFDGSGIVPFDCLTPEHVPRPAMQLQLPVRLAAVHDAPPKFFLAEE